MLNKRQEEIINVLEKQNDWIIGKELSNMFHVSDRTIRSDIDAINKYYKYSLIKSSSRSGYCIDSENKKSAVNEDSSSFPQTPNERCLAIIRKLLFETKELNLTLLQEQIYVSGHSIDNDIKKIRKMLKLYPSLELVRSKEYLSLKGDEGTKRKLYKDLLSAEIHGNFLNLNQMASLYKNFDLLYIKDIFVEVLNEYQYSINESLFPMLILHIGIGLERIIHYNFVQPNDSKEFLEETIEYQISKTFFERTANKIDINVVEEEIKLLALLLMGKKSSNYTSDFTRINGKWINVEKLVEKILIKLYDLFGIDFRYDKDLILGLKMHVHGLLERKKNNIDIENIFLSDIKRKYPLIFDMGIYVGKFIEEELEITIGETESGFIAIHLGSASERINVNRKYRAVVILPLNQSFSSLCISKISSMFNERMEIIETFQFFEKEKILKLNPDLILTTSLLVHELDILTIQISLFVNTETESSIIQALNKLDKKRFHVEFTSRIGKLIDKEHFYSGLELSTSNEIIEYMCSKISKDININNNFKKAVLKREEMSPTSFTNYIAIPHAFGTFENESIISIAQLKHPVKWGSFNVKLIILLAINEGDHGTVKMFFDWISNAMNDTNYFSMLLTPCEYEEFIEIITN